MKLNRKAYDKAESLIESGEVVKDSDWSEVQPSSDDENELLDSAGWSGYHEWFLGIDTDENEETKGHYNFPYGDFKKVHRSAVIAIKQRGAQNDYDDIVEAADKLLNKIGGED